MASGDHHSGSASNDQAPDRGSTPPGTAHYHSNQFNFQAPLIARAEITTDVLIVQTQSACFRSRRQRPDAEDQALSEIPPEQDVCSFFTEDELNRKIEDKFLSYVAHSCDESSNWKKLARKMRFDSNLVSRLLEDYGDNIRELIYQLMLNWKRRNPNVVVRDLVKLLNESKLQKSALELKMYFSSIHEAD